MRARAWCVFFGERGTWDLFFFLFLFHHTPTHTSLKKKAKRAFQHKCKNHTHARGSVERDRGKKRSECGLFRRRDSNPINFTYDKHVFLEGGDWGIYLVDRELLRRGRATPILVYICAFCVLKAGHDNHLHHSESAWMAVPASFLAYGIRYVLRLLLSSNNCC